MLIELKQMLLDNPESIKNILEHYDYYHINIRSNEIRFARSKDGNRNSICIKLKNNNKLYVCDYARNISKDFFTYIISQRNVNFKNVLNIVKKELNIIDYYSFSYKQKSIFGGFYNKIKKKAQDNQIQVYDNSILSQYKYNGNIRFLKDNISLLTQRNFGIRYDIESQGIVIPIYDVCGHIIGIKTRCNWEVPEDEQKYYYLVPCKISETLYGYYQNYNYLTNNIIYIVESEKSVLQAYSYGLYNFVATGGSFLSPKQCLLLMELSPESIIFLYDEGLDEETINRNINKIRSYSKMFDINIGYWNSKSNIDIEKKCSPTDLGKDKLKEILENQIVFIERSNNAENLESN